MSRAEQLTVDVVLSLLLFLVPAFVLHSSPRFAGSLAGFVLGVAAAALMVALLIYPLSKYSARFRTWITRVTSTRALLAFHVYAGVFGVFLAILHTGHKYQSPLGIALVITMLIVVSTGVVGRYYLPQTSTELREGQSRLATLRSAYDRTALALAEGQVLENTAEAIRSPAPRDVPIRQLVESIADLEYAIEFREVIKKIFMRWMIAHVIAAIIMYLLLTLHIAGEIYYGLRWVS